MQQPLPTAQDTVADVLERWPQSRVVFVRYGMACIGCAMARFDTLVEVAAAYGLRVERLLEALHEAICGMEEAI